MTADQMIRFWDLNELQGNQGPIFKMCANQGDIKDD